jgi:starvation-inducible DNA-binding protein
MMEELQKAAKIAFASEYAFVIKAQNFHWNVEGMFFEQFHALFGGIYEEVYGSIEYFAENIRKLDSYAPASFQRFSMLTQVDDETEILDSKSMVIELLNDSDKMVKILKMVYDLSEQNGEHGFSNFLAERMDAHRKHSWMLRSTLK